MDSSSDPRPPAAASSTVAGGGTAEAKAEGGRGKAEEKPALTLDLLVREWLASDCSAAARVIWLGYRADLWIAGQAKNHVARAAAVQRIVDGLKRLGIRGEALRVSRTIGIYWVAKLFNYRTKATAKLAASAPLPASTLRALLPLVKRNPKTQAWEIRRLLRDAALELWARIETEKLTAAAVRQAVLKLRPARIAPPSRRKAARLAILARLDELSIDDATLVMARLRERLQTLASQQRAA